MQTARPAISRDYKAWLCEKATSRPHFLHSMIRIREPERSLSFYCDGLEMALLGQFDVNERRVSAFFVGYALGSIALELAHYWDEPAAFVHGSTYSHLVLGVPDVDETSSRLDAMDAEFFMRPCALMDRWPRTAFVRDPDGYLIQLLQIDGAGTV